jgi:AraC family transcriptional regulator
MEIAVKNMVCARCIKVVKQVLDSLNILYNSVDPGHIETKETLTRDQYNALKDLLEKEGFALMEDQKAALVEQVKNLIIDLVYNKDLTDFCINLSVYLSNELHKDYTAISQLFSSVENTTIEQYFILQKLERVKEMLVYDQLPLSEIAWKMGYSSVAHLSAQFKKITGFTPSQFRNLKGHKKVFIDKIK